MQDFLRENNEELQAFVRISAAIGARADYVQGGGGNTSVKLKGALMAIKASGYRLCDIKPADGYAVLNGEAVRDFYASHEPDEFADVEASGAQFVKEQITAVDGMLSLRPSVEAGFHSLLDKFVIHSHSVYANLAACTSNGEEIIERALKDAPYSWAFVAYTDPGAKLTFRIRDALRSGGSGKAAVIVMQNHGLIVHHDDEKRVLEIHDDVNRRLGEAYKTSEADYPAVKVRGREDGLFESDTQYLHEKLAAYAAGDLLEKPLCPDQMVYLNGTLEEGEGLPAPGKCIISGGRIVYNMDEAKALVIEETATAVVFVMETVKKCGYELSTMEDAAQNFIANWESEKYRKSLLQK